MHHTVDISECKTSHVSQTHTYKISKLHHKIYFIQLICYDERELCTYFFFLKRRIVFFSFHFHPRYNIVIFFGALMMRCLNCAFHSTHNRTGNVSYIALHFAATHTSFVCRMIRSLRNHMKQLCMCSTNVHTTHRQRFLYACFKLLFEWFRWCKHVLCSFDALPLSGAYVHIFRSFIRSFVRPFICIHFLLNTCLSHWF